MTAVQSGIADVLPARIQGLAIGSLRPSKDRRSDSNRQSVPPPGSSSQIIESTAAGPRTSSVSSLLPATN